MVICDLRKMEKTLLTASKPFFGLYLKSVIHNAEKYNHADNSTLTFSFYQGEDENDAGFYRGMEIVSNYGVLVKDEEERQEFKKSLCKERVRADSHVKDKTLNGSGSGLRTLNVLGGLVGYELSCDPREKEFVNFARSYEFPKKYENDFETHKKGDMIKPDMKEINEEVMNMVFHDYRYVFDFVAAVDMVGIVTEGNIIDHEEKNKFIGVYGRILEGYKIYSDMKNRGSVDADKFKKITNGEIELDKLEFFKFDITKGMVVIETMKRAYDQVIESVGDLQKYVDRYGNDKSKERVKKMIDGLTHFQENDDFYRDFFSEIKTEEDFYLRKEVDLVETLVGMVGKDNVVSSTG
jgi:hypothetical protein